MPDFKVFKRWVTTDWRAHRKWREDSREDFSFVAGDQWSEDEKEDLTEQMRPVIVFNRTATIINAVVGSEINNRTEVRFLPRTLGDAEVNEQLTKGAEWFRDQSGAEEEDSQAFFDSVVCGVGWSETLMDFESDSEGEPKMERINPLEMCWDSGAEKRGLTDARRIARVRKISMDEAEEMWPDADKSALSADWLDQRGEEKQSSIQWSDDDYSHHDDDGDDDGEDEEETATIVQLQYRVRIREVEYKDPITGARGVLGRREFNRLRDMIRKMGHDVQFPSREIIRYEWKQVIMGNEILEENKPCADRPTFTPITGYWDNTKRQWYGLLRQMKDPQKFANKWLSQTLHIINSNSKGGLLAETDATDNPEELEEQWSASDAVVWLRPGSIANNKIQPKPSVQMPAALMQLTEFAISSIRDVSGVNQELLGMRDQNQPGVLEYQRKQAAMTTLAVLFDALRQYRKQQGEVLLYYMTKYMADGRLIRISDEEGERFERLQLDPSIRKYDVIVDDAPSSPNNKERVWETITALMPVLVQADLPKQLWGEIIAYAPFPAALIEKMKEFAMKPDQPDPETEKMKALTIQKLMAEVEKAKSGADRDSANAFENIAQGLLALSKAQSAPLEASQEIMKDAAQKELALSKMGLDADKARMDTAMKMTQIIAQSGRPSNVQ